MNRLNEPHQRDLFEGIDPIEFARAKLVQGLRNVVQQTLGGNGAVITPEELVLAEIPAKMKVANDRTVFAFRLRRDIKARLLFIMFKKNPDGSLNFQEQAIVWQEKDGQNPMQEC